MRGEMTEMGIFYEAYDCRSDEERAADEIGPDLFCMACSSTHDPGNDAATMVRTCHRHAAVPGNEFEYDLTAFFQENGLDEARLTASLAVRRAEAAAGGAAGGEREEREERKGREMRRKGAVYGRLRVLATSTIRDGERTTTYMRASLRASGDAAAAMGWLWDREQVHYQLFNRGELSWSRASTTNGWEGTIVTRYDPVRILHSDFPADTTLTIDYPGRTVKRRRPEDA